MFTKRIDHRVRTLAFAWSLLPIVGGMLNAPTVLGADIDGKWGLGVGVFNHRSEASILKGLSNRTALLVEVGIHQAEFSFSNESGPPLPISQSGNAVAVELGPRLRRFTRPDEVFSPYFDLFVRGSFSNSTANGSNQLETWGTRAGIGFGAEYFLTRLGVLEDEQDAHLC